MDTWCHMGHMSKLSELEKRGLKNHFLGRKHQIFGLVMGERWRKKKEKEKIQTSLFDLWSSVCKNSSAKNESSSTR